MMGAGRGTCTSAGCGVRAEGAWFLDKKQPRSTREGHGRGCREQGWQLVGSLAGTKRRREGAGGVLGVGGRSEYFPAGLIALPDSVDRNAG